MTRPKRVWRYPLALKLLAGLLLNFVLVIALFLALPGHNGAGWDLLLTTPVRERLLSAGDRVSAALSPLPVSQWKELLAAESARRGVELRTRDQQHPPGPPPGGFDRPSPGAAREDLGGVPGEHRPRLWEAPPEGDSGHGFDQPPDRPPQSPPGPPGQGPQTDRNILADMISVTRLGWREGYAVRIPMQIHGGPVDLDVRVAGTFSLLRFLGIADWVLFASLCLLATALVWLPFAWGLTRAIGALTRATETIAQGRFDVRVPLARRDELGQLADSVNDMAARLERQVETQKQFVADVAHEVTAPLARLRVGLELLAPGDAARFAAVRADLEDDAQQMSTLLDELLLFSRTGQTAGREAATACVLAMLVRDAVEQEAADAETVAAIHTEVPADLIVRVPAALVQRALANLIRNALRYGQSGIEIVAAAEGDTAALSVRDRGPGVPPEALARLGEAFYRPDFARHRTQGGTGLGLAIVRRCLAAANGSVVFRNREGGGFEASLTLPLA